ncbi:MAG: hypothetical protein V3W01_04165, partial [Dehalococcoidales bacterium]
MPNGLVWLIFLLPLVSFAVISLLIRLLGRRNLSGHISIGATLVSFLLSLWALLSLLSAPADGLAVPGFNWLVIE